MGTRDRRVDAYIAKAPEFSKPILTQLRDAMHEVCPDVEETMKWSRPAFLYHGLLGGMSAFKEHATFGFWKGALIVDKAGSRVDDAHGNFGRMQTVKDLPPKRELTRYIKKAMELNESGTKVVRAATPRGPVEPPEYFLKALRRGSGALAQFKKFTASKQREYVEWLEEAKTDATRQKRLASAVEWIAEGKTRNWKYENC